MALELIPHEILGELPGVAQTLQAAVHVACVSQVFEPHHASPSSEVFLFKVELLECSWSPPLVLLLQLALCFVVLPIFLEAVYVAVFDRFALAKLEVI